MKFCADSPDPRLVALVNFAIDSIVAKPYSAEHRKKYAKWFDWAFSWKSGQRHPMACVRVARSCFAVKDSLISHTLGQVAWAAKESCYREPTSAWLVVRYIADAMIAFNIAFPDGIMRPLLEGKPTQLDDLMEADKR